MNTIDLINKYDMLTIQRVLLGRNYKGVCFVVFNLFLSEILLDQLANYQI